MEGKNYGKEIIEKSTCIKKRYRAIVILSPPHTSALVARTC